MKVISLLVLIAIFAVIESSIDGFTKKNCSDYEPNWFVPDVSKPAFSKDFCASLHVKEPTNKCCYLKFKDNDNTFYSCYELTEEEFWDIDKEIDDIKIFYDVKNLVCDSSSYLTGSLLLFLLYLF